MSAPAPDCSKDPGLPFRTVAPFLCDLMAARMLATAFPLGIIDALAQKPATAGTLAARFALAPRGAALLVAILAGNNVLETHDGVAALTAPFRAALRYRDLMETKLAFADHVLGDVGELLGAFLGDGGEFLARSRAFDLFRYDRAKHPGADNLAATRAWVRFTTGLTRYESAGLLALFDIPAGAAVLDIGGNSGEMAAAIVRAHPTAHATVFDLPLVCAIGRAHLAATPQAAAVDFVEGDLRHDALPGGMDVAIFKSVLHDWPEQDAARFLARAYDALKPGGRLVIFERCPFDLQADTRIAYHDISNLMFLHHLRAPDFYRATLARLGASLCQDAQIVLDMPFFLLAARKPHV